MFCIKIFDNIKYIGRNISDRFLNVGQNSGVHGLKYVFDLKSTKIIRLIWLVILIILSGCLYSLLVPVIQRSAAISFVADTDHLQWQTKFPAVTVCETFSHRRVEKKLAEEFPDLVANLNYGYKRYIADLIFGRGTYSKSVCEDCGGHLACDIPWRDIIERVHKSCDEMLIDCRFNDDIFSCCKEFRIVDSVFGPCFSFNTLQTNGGSLFHVNRTTGPGLLSFRLLADAQVTVHSSEELPTNFMNKNDKLEIKIKEKHVNIIFSTVQVEIEPQLGEEDITIRKCRHNDEIPNEPLYTYPVYSYGACRLARSTFTSFQHCGCVHPVRDVSYKDMYCNYTGLNCLVGYDVQKTKLGVDEDSSSSDCLPACEESQLKIIHYSTRSDIESSSDGALVELKMAALPTLKYNKILMRTNLDLVVTVGGMVGLFFSASILSLAEILYLMFRT